MASQPVLRMEQSGANPAVIVADKWLRVAGYFIDVVPAIVLGLVSLIPIVGIIFAGLLLAPYWLLRDVAGASLGKLLLGMRIVGQDGHPATTGARVLRNLPLIAAPRGTALHDHSAARIYRDDPCRLDRRFGGRNAVVEPGIKAGRQDCEDGGGKEVADSKTSVRRLDKDMS